MKPLHAGSNYKFLCPFIKKMAQTGRNVFKAGLGMSRLIISDQGRTFREYGQVYRIGYADRADQYFEIAVSDEQKTVMPMRYVDLNAVSLDNSVAPMRELSCFWFSWENPCPKQASIRVVDTMLWEWTKYLSGREYYNAKYA